MMFWLTPADVTALVAMKNGDLKRPDGSPITFCNVRVSLRQTETHTEEFVMRRPRGDTDGNE